MERYAVIGNPIAHSQSPFIHAQFALQAGLALNYERLLSPLDHFATTVTQFRQTGGRGCNVTTPFKFEAFKLATLYTQRAALAGAANILRFEEYGWWADNTDGWGLVRDVEHNAGMALRGLRVLLIGAGGAAAGSLGALVQAQPTELVVANRSLDKAQVLLERHAALATACGVSMRVAPLSNCGAAFDIIVNASTSSLQGANIPVDSCVLRNGCLALDMMYGPAAQGFLAWAAGHGAQTRDGLGMLVEQASESFFIWHGVRPNTALVLDELRARLEKTSP